MAEIQPDQPPVAPQLGTHDILLLMDVESSGVPSVPADCEFPAVLELSAAAVEWPSCRVVSSHTSGRIGFDGFLFDWDAASEKVHGIDRLGAEGLRFQYPPERALHNFGAWRRRHFPGPAVAAGWNVQFDVSLLQANARRLRNRAGREITELSSLVPGGDAFDHRRLDLASLSFLLFGFRSSRRACRALGVERELHSATQDLEWSLELLRRLSRFHRPRLGRFLGGLR